MQIPAVLRGKVEASTSNRTSPCRGLSLAVAVCLLTLTGPTGTRNVRHSSNAFPTAAASNGRASFTQLFEPPDPCILLHFCSPKAQNAPAGSVITQL
jgi:hypothetical protein